MEKNRFEFWCKSKSWNFWALSVNNAFDSAQILVFFQDCATSRKLSNGNLMEGSRVVITKKKQFEGNDFTLSGASFGRIGKPEFETKDRSKWLCNPVFLLKYKGFVWHTDGTNQNWVHLRSTEFEYRDIIHNIKTLLGFFWSLVCLV